MYTLEMKAPIFIRGIMPRSGTNFLIDIFKQHEDVQVSPGRTWEFPHPYGAPTLQRYVDLVSDFPNAPGFRRDRFMQCLGNAWLEYLQDVTEPGKRIVLKTPTVDDVDSFFDFFPEALLVLIVRDGRDLVASALEVPFMRRPGFSLRDVRTWPQFLGPSHFTALCRRYAAAAGHVAEFERGLRNSDHAGRFRLVRYESLYLDQENEVRDLLAWAGLSDDKYDWSALDSMPVRGSSFLRGKDGGMDFGQGVPRTGEFAPVGRWKSWSSARRRVFDREAGDAMSKLGYEYEWA